MTRVFAVAGIVFALLMAWPGPDISAQSFEHPIITRMTPEPIEATTFTDPDAGGGYTSRRYYVVAVDALGQEGYPSSPVWHNREWKRYYEPFVGQWHQ